MTAIGGTVDGFVAAGYEGVRDAFGRNFAEHGEVGATVAAYGAGKQCGDLWGGGTGDGAAHPSAQFPQRGHECGDGRGRFISSSRSPGHAGRNGSSA